MNFEMDEQTATGMINYLSAQPIHSGLTPLVAMLVAQFNEQKKQETPNEPASN